MPHITLNIGICILRDPLTYVQKSRAEMHVPSDQTQDHAIVDHAIASDRRYVVIYRQEA